MIHTALDGHQLTHLPLGLPILGIDTEARLSQTSELMAAVVSYAKTRPVFDGYKAAKYSKKYLAQHEAELADYRAAKAAINDILGGAKLPKVVLNGMDEKELIIMEGAAEGIRKARERSET